MQSQHIIFNKKIVHASRYNFNETAYTVMVQPHLEYGNVVWHPQLKQNVELLEAVQHRDTKMIPGQSHLSYEERLKRMGLPSLSYRRLRGDAIETFKHLHGFFLVESTSHHITKMLPLAQPTEGVSTRDHELKQQKRAYRTSIWVNVLGQRIVNWNLLPEDLVTCGFLCDRTASKDVSPDIVQRFSTAHNSLKTLFKWRHLCSKSVYRPFGLMTEYDDDEVTHLKRLKYQYQCQSIVLYCPFRNDDSIA